jgi:hypothetical protein
MKIGIVDAANLCMRNWHGAGRGHSAYLAATGVCKQLAAFAKDGLLDGIVWVKEGVPERRLLESDGEYKANRGNRNKPTADFFETMWFLLRHLPVFGVVHPRYEADDVIALLARRLKADGHQVIVFSGDTDFLQLEEGIDVWKNVSESIVSKKRHLQREFRGENYLNFKSLVGDTSDNIPGVRGVGAITAQRIVEGGLDVWLANQDEGVIAEFNRAKSMISFEEVDLPLHPILRANTDWDAMRRAFQKIASQIGGKGWSSWQIAWFNLQRRADDVEGLLRPFLDEDFRTIDIELIAEED